MNKKEKGWSVPYVMAAHIDFEGELDDEVQMIRDQMEWLQRWRDKWGTLGDSLTYGKTCYAWEAGLDQILNEFATQIENFNIQKPKHNKVNKVKDLKFAGEIESPLYGIAKAAEDLSEILRTQFEMIFGDDPPPGNLIKNEKFDKRRDFTDKQLTKAIGGMQDAADTALS